MARPRTSETASEQAVAGLTRLGFTNAEAEVYVALLGESPATGYRIASILGKAAANTYKALHSLADKGAVLAEEGDGSRFRPVPPGELLQRMTHEFESRRDDTLGALEELGDPGADLGVYRLTDYEQVVERARAMLADAREVALAVGFPAPLAALRPEFEAAAARGVDIGVKGYTPLDIAGVEYVLSTQSEHWLEALPGEEFMLVVDGEEYLLALLDGDEVLQAIWSASPFLAYVYHNGLSLEQHVTKLARAIGDGRTLKELRAQLALARSPDQTPGYRRLLDARNRRRRGRAGHSAESEPSPARAPGSKSTRRG
ncbi:TrmB family transcriptional regulator [Haliangium sp.]|uniref:TrmB family transcriptional regulator n=1 Tax=Haliangium sp. TaxID=2663208 RepID=UPI003D129861